MLVLSLASDCIDPCHGSFYLHFYPNETFCFQFCSVIRNGMFCCICLIIFLYAIRDNCPPPQKVVQQPQPQHPAPPPFSPILPRSADGFSPRQHSTSVQQPQQQQQQQPKSIGSHHYRSVPPAEPQYHQQRHADGSQSWNEWTQQLLVRFLPVLVLLFYFFLSL